MQFGPEIGYRLLSPYQRDTIFEPFAAIRGVWDFDDPNVAIIDGVIVGLGRFWARLEGGFVTHTLSGFLLRAFVSWDGLGAGNYNGYTLNGSLNIPLD